ncbi:alpha/beta-hydrolase [Peniophora sp. CONT]|nr:alpha/beta-hydrolase [Peniophora sp. CONT]
MPTDYYYPLKWLGMNTTRAGVSLAEILLTPPPRPTPDLQLSYVPTTDPRHKPRAMHVYLPDKHVTYTEPLPVHITIHGSGFCINTFGKQDQEFCAWLATAVPCVVVDIDHRKAPEAPWPAGPDDVRDAVRSVRELAQSRGWDSERISIGGFSSGGCLALVEASRPRHEDESSVVACVAFYPSTDLAEAPLRKDIRLPKVKQGEESAGTSIPHWFRRFMYSCYLPRSKIHDSSHGRPCDPPPGMPTRAHPRISPFYAPSKNFPPTAIITGSVDALAQEGRTLIERLGKDDVDAIYWSAEGQGHNWDHDAKKGTRPEKIKWEAYEFACGRLQAAYGAVS